jgi:general secretion pathway protein K
VKKLKHQRGIAVITAMLVVALGTITIVAIAARQQFDLQREQNEGLIQMARDFAISGERFAVAMLYRDRKDGLRNNSDSLDDDWAQTIPPVPIDNAAIKGCIIDMQGRFNLNNLIDDNGDLVVQYFEQLQRLLGGLGIDQVKAQAIADWVDKDVNATVPDGAEDDYYTGLDPAYRAANQPFYGVSELLLVKGFSANIEEEKADYDLLVPHISALPVDSGPTAVNVNTATPEVIASLSDFLEPLGADLSRWDTGAYEDYPECEDIFDLDAKEGPATFTSNRDLTPYESVTLFDAAAAPGAGTEVAPPGSYDVQSRYYQVRIDMATEGLSLSQFTLLERQDDGRVKVISRSRDTL